MIDTRQFGDEALERAQLSRDIDGRRVELALEASQDLAVQAAPIGLRARFQPGMQLRRHVLKGKIDHLAPLGHHFGSFKHAADKVTGQGVILPSRGRLIDVHIGRDRTDRVTHRAGPRSGVV
jgi:hypothetical protein